MDAVEPMPIVPFEVEDETLETEGERVSNVIDTVLLAVLSFPAVSVKFAPAMEIEPVPEFVFVVGVNTTE